MKIGVMSDTHLRQITDELKKVVERLFSDTDIILHAGDIVSPVVLQYLKTANVIAVSGNMDHYETSQALPYKRIIEAGPFKIGLIHGWGSPYGLAQKLRKEFDKIDCLVFGHSHQPLNSWVGSELYFNPGSMTLGKRDQKRSVGTLHINKTIQGEIITLD
ncbi:MAG: metallophosphoesterase family protein [Deltaproteobacteria bacterium]|nr:metallophosphoesterase family protein [Deltaproteobacteria bacterium]MBW2139698.1 metallophosphoesterase family protein [Deltaproteobacteria bacterium]MBW2321963.1 metallophosphoesterase family protein [Deltaproteobacteria bacterium]